jgi:hypothetical protein
MKKLIGSIRLGVLAAVSVALGGGHERTEANETTTQRSNWQPHSDQELVLLNIDGTVFAQEVNLAPHAS